MHDHTVRSARKESMCGRMDFGHVKMNVEDDRLSSLTDDLIHKILSFNSVSEAIGMSVLSSRWRFIWPSLPYLNFEDFSTLPKFSKLVSNVLSQRNNQTPVYSVKLLFKRAFCNESVIRIINYAFSQNVQQLSATFNKSFYIPTTDWDIPALTTLHFDGIPMTDKCTLLFSKCTNLKNLSLGRYTIYGTDALNIFHPRLANLKLEEAYDKSLVVNVVAPQLKNLTIVRCYGKHLISAPGLTSLVIQHALQVTIQDPPSLNKMDLCILDPLLKDVDKIVSLLQQLHSVKFLTLNLEILELLSTSMGVMAHQPSPFANTKILRFSASIYRVKVYLEVLAKEKSTPPIEIKNYDKSDQRTIFTMVSREEIRVIRAIISAQQLVLELRELQKKGKALTDTNQYHMERPNAPMVSCNEQINPPWQSAKLQQYLRKTNAQFKQNKIKKIMRKLKHIEGLLTELPALNRPVMQARLSMLSEEVAIAHTNNMLDCITIPYTEKLKRLNV